MTKIPGIILRLPTALERIQLALGTIHARVDQLDSRPRRPSEHEFQVFSQWGEDGIIHYLTACLPRSPRVFIELGVENYIEANTRFLAQAGNWRGLIIDGSQENMAFVRQDSLHWRSHLNAVAAFITRENVNELISSAGFSGRIGLLSIDLDGNDYWIWERLNAASPDIVVCEYNALFGAKNPVTVPYDPAFHRGSKHFSHLYFGASLPALEKLGALKGYSLVDVNTAGGNAFFVRSELLAEAKLKAVTAEECFRPPVFRESRDENHRLSFLAWPEAQELLRNAKLPLINVVTNQPTSTEHI